MFGLGKKTPPAKATAKDPEREAMLEEYIGIVDRYAQDSMRRDPEFRSKHPKLYEWMKKNGTNI